MYVEPTNTGQVYSVLIGRTTPTILWLVELNKWHGYFGIFPAINREIVEGMQQVCIDKRFLCQSDEDPQKYKLTSDGKDYIKHNTQDIFLIPSNGFTKSTHRDKVWELYQFVTQIVSEKEAHNRNFSPIVTHPAMQRDIKLWLKDSRFSTQQWIRETVWTIENSLTTHKMLLSNLLVGNGVFGCTERQLQHHLELSESAFFLKKHCAIQHWINDVSTAAQTPLLSTFLDLCDKRAHYRLSESTFTTAQLLNKGYSIADIATERYMKVSTIHEHILEMAFILNDFPYRIFIPKELYHQLIEMFESGIDTYKKASQHIHKLTFMHFRLFELERARSSDGT